MSKPPPEETGSGCETGSVYILAYTALRRGDTTSARALTDQILDEAVEARDLFPRFIGRHSPPS